MGKEFVKLQEEAVRQTYIKQRPFNSLHEAYGVLMEEVAELFDQIRLHPEQRNLDNLLEELLDIAATVQRAAEDFKLVDRQPFDGPTRQDKIEEVLRNLLTNMLERYTSFPPRQKGKKNTIAFEFDPKELAELKDKYFG